MVAEDEKAMLHALEIKLTKAGFFVDTVNNGKEVLEKLKSEKYDLLLLDVMMPFVNGFEVLEELQKMKNSVPVIITSNLGQEEDEARARKLGAKDYLVKSNTPISKVLEKVQAILK